LISARLLKPLGNPAQNSTKYFATADVLETAKQALGLGFVSGSQTGLFAGGDVLGIEYARAPE
jgi:hypothetical protein